MSDTLVQRAIEARSVSRVYRLPRTSLRHPAGEVRALTDVTFDVHERESFGIVGESGSGKSTLARILVALDKPTSGTVTFRGVDVATLRGKSLADFRKRVQIVFQDPMGSLDPRMSVGRIIGEPLHHLRIDAPSGRVAELLSAVGLPADSVRRFPHEFSGGQRQRIAIARALAPAPEVLVADEPVSALDVSVRAQILNLLDDLKEQYNFTLILISHDLSVVLHMCERVAIMNAGRIVESGLTDSVFNSPKDPYTAKLLDSIPRLQLS